MMKPRFPSVFGSLLLLISLGSTACAQHPNSAPKKAPQLTTDDIKQSTSSQEDAYLSKTASLKRYSPDEMNLSIELPGAPDPLEIPMPENATREVSGNRAYVYTNDQLSVLSIRFYSKKALVTTDELRNLAAGFLDSVAKRVDVSDVQSFTKMRDESTILIMRTHREQRGIIETRGLVHTKGRSIWLIAARFAQVDQEASALALRVINSVRIE